MTRIIDLTLTLAPGVGHPMFRRVHLAPFHVHEIHRRSNADLFMALHTATHIDAPYHFVRDGTPIDRVPLDQLIGPGALFRVQDLARPRHRFTVAELERAVDGGDAGRGALRGKIAVIATGWSDRTFADPVRYFGESPTLGPEAARWLADGGVKAVVLDCATDAPEPVPVPEQVLPVHHVLLERGIPIVENCTALVQIPGPHTLYAAPLKIEAESGAPARVFAVVEG
jgi:kynurenine formamidase